MLALYLDSDEHVGSKTRHRVLISAEGRWRIVLEQSNGQEWLNQSLDGRALKPSFLVCRPFTILYDVHTCLHYLDSGEHVGSETRHRVLISAEEC